MRENSEFRERLIEARLLDSHNKISRSIDPLAYSMEFEAALLPKITLFQATLDYVALQLQSPHQRRILTRLEHNMLAMAELAFEQSASFGLDHRERDAVATAFLMQAVRSALQMVITGMGRARGLESILKRLGASDSKVTDNNAFLSWDDSQNLSDLLDFNSHQEVKLQAGNAARKLHYLCQLSVFTSTPKRQDEYPLSVLVSPSEYFSLTNMWARKPLLWSRNASVTQSGKLILSKFHADSETVFRRDLGALANLHLELARLIQLRCNSYKNIAAA